MSRSVQNKPAEGLTSLVPSSSERASEHPALVSLRTEWTQLDEDGVSIGVSRQAVEETLALFDEMRKALRNLATGASVAMTDEREFFSAKINRNIETAREVLAKAGGR
jgi:hypothetical protein